MRKQGCKKWALYVPQLVALLLVFNLNLNATAFSQHQRLNLKLEVVTPEENMGDVIGDLNKRRGQVEGMESSRSGARIVKAMVPLAEMFGYVTALRTITSGRATSSMVYSHHAQVSNSIAKAVLEEVKGRADLL